MKLAECNDYKEKQVLHPLFKAMLKESNSTVIGCPDWLLEKSTSQLHADIIPSYVKSDELWENEHDATVFEFKNTNKHQMYALPQVLQYAWNYKHQEDQLADLLPGKKVLPVIVTRQDFGMRSALSYLFDHGFKKNAVRYLEACRLRGDNNHYYWWFWEPFGEEYVDGVPPFNPYWQDKGLCWKKIRDCTVWVGVTPGTDLKPPYLPSKCGFVVGVSGKENHYVIWNCGIDDSPEYSLKLDE